MCEDRQPLKNNLLIIRSRTAIAKRSSIPFDVSYMKSTSGCLPPQHDMINFCRFTQLY